MKAWPGRVVIDMLRLGSASSCGGTVKVWRALSAAVAKLDADLAQAPRVLIWGGGLQSSSTGGHTPEAVFESRSQCRSTAETQAQRAAHCFGTSLLLSPWGLTDRNGSSSNASSSIHRSSKTSSGSHDTYTEPSYSDEDAVLCAMVNADVFVQGLGGMSAIAAAVRERRQYPTLVADFPDGCLPWECTSTNGKERAAMPPLRFELCSSHKNFNVRSNAARPARAPQKKKSGAQKQRGVDKAVTRAHKPIPVVDDFPELKMQPEDTTLLGRTAALMGLENGTSSWNRKAWVSAAALGASVAALGCVWLIRKVCLRLRHDMVPTYNNTSYNPHSSRAERRLRHKFRVAARTESQDYEQEEKHHLRLDSTHSHPTTTNTKTKKTRSSNSK